MIPNEPGRKPNPAGLAQQEADFTSEGAPPPGNVATTVPKTANTPGKSRSRTRTPAGSHGKRAPQKAIP